LRSLRRSAALCCLLAACVPAVAAETLLYTLEIPDSRSVTYELPLAVEHPGRLIVRAEWDGPRQLALRIDRPDSPVAVARRSGPSPLVLELDILPDEDGPLDWKLAIHAVAAKGASEGLLTIELPSPAAAAPPEATPAAEPPAPDAPPWMESRRAPAGSPAAWVRLFTAGERYRALLDPSEAPAPGDACRWQDDLMRYVAGSLDALAGGSLEPAAPTRRMLERIAAAVDRVEELRTSDDPLIVGPPPDDRQRRELWLRLRRERVQPIEAELDELAELLQRGHAPELQDLDWPVRLVTCLTACERHFEARGRVGEEHATSRDLARDQWDRLRAAAEVLRAIAGLGGPLQDAS